MGRYEEVRPERGDALPRICVKLTPDLAKVKPGSPRTRGDRWQLNAYIICVSNTPPLVPEPYLPPSPPPLLALFQFLWNGLVLAVLEEDVAEGTYRFSDRAI